MHELALTEGMVKILEEQAVLSDFRSVKTVWLEIGALSQVDPHAIEFCFAAVTRGTIADGARLEIVRPPGRAWCMVCSETVTVAERFEPCPCCGGHQLQITGGEEMRIKELEVE